MKVARSSRNAGTYATAMKDMNAEPKNYVCTGYKVSLSGIIYIVSDDDEEEEVSHTIAFMNGWIDSWTGASRSQTVPIMMARPKCRVHQKKNLVPNQTQERNWFEGF